MLEPVAIGALMCEVAQTETEFRVEVAGLLQECGQRRLESRSKLRCTCLVAGNMAAAVMLVAGVGIGVVVQIREVRPAKHHDLGLTRQHIAVEFGSVAIASTVASRLQRLPLQSRATFHLWLRSGICLCRSHRATWAAFGRAASAA